MCLPGDAPAGVLGIVHAANADLISFLGPAAALWVFNFLAAVGALLLASKVLQVGRHLRRLLQRNASTAAHTSRKRGDAISAAPTEELWVCAGILRVQLGRVCLLCHISYRHLHHLPGRGADALASTACAMRIACMLMRRISCAPMSEVLILVICLQFFQTEDQDDELAYYSEMREAGFIDAQDENFDAF